MEIIENREITVSMGENSLDSYSIRCYHNAELECDEFSLKASGKYSKKMRQVFTQFTEFLTNDDMTEMEIY
jgi:hypothetical protein